MESNRRRTDLQSAALPAELTVLKKIPPAIFLITDGVFQIDFIYAECLFQHILRNKAVLLPVNIVVCS